MTLRTLPCRCDLSTGRRRAYGRAGVLVAIRVGEDGTNAFLGTTYAKSEPLCYTTRRNQGRLPWKTVTKLKYWFDVPSM